ncbi:MAG: YihY/virulence factor BrkB family protein [Syntrophothermus sp.]|nr:YihY/virulence factor BrkB family protein [Ignavibacteriaceae bacterium]
MKFSIKGIFNFIKQSFTKWSDDKAPKLGAALSYYTIFSIAPLLVIAISVAGLIFGQDAAQGRVVLQLQGLLGHDGAQFVQDALKNSSDVKTGIIAGIASVVTLFIASTAVFIELQDSLNMIWGVKPKPVKNFVTDFMKKRVISFAIVVGIGFLLLVSLLVSAVISALNDYVAEKFVAVPLIVLHIFNIVFSLAVIFTMFAMIYKVLPDAHIEWRDTWFGAGVTSVLFVLGKFLIGLYIGRSSYSSTYGAAGSLIIVLVWVYYSAQILFLGAEFTQVYADKYGSGIRPTKDAVPLENCEPEVNFKKS